MSGCHWFAVGAVAVTIVVGLAFVAFCCLWVGGKSDQQQTGVDL